MNEFQQTEQHCQSPNEMTAAKRSDDRSKLNASGSTIWWVDSDSDLTSTIPLNVTVRRLPSIRSSPDINHLGLQQQLGKQECWEPNIVNKACMESTDGETTDADEVDGIAHRDEVDGLVPREGLMSVKSVPNSHTHSVSDITLTAYRKTSAPSILISSGKLSAKQEVCNYACLIII